MRKIVTFNRVSADGYFTTGDGALDWAVADPEVDKAGAEGIPRTDTILFGRKTYQQFESFWPHVLDAPTVPDPHRPGASSPQMRAFAVALTEMTKLVFSKTLKQTTWKNARIFPELDPRKIQDLKKQPGKEIIIFGSGAIVSQLTQHRLIDEYCFVVNPLLLGNGRPLVREVPSSLKLELLEAKTFPSGNVILRYARAT